MKRIYNNIGFLILSLAIAHALYLKDRLTMKQTRTNLVK